MWKKWRKPNAVVELEKKNEELQRVLDEKNEMEKQIEEPIGDWIVEDQEDQEEEENNNDEPEETENTEEVIEEEKEEIKIPPYVPVDLNKFKDKDFECYTIDNWYIFPWIPRHSKKCKIYHINRGKGPIIRIYDLDRYKASQLAWTALYGRKPMPVWVIVLLVLIWFLFVWIIIFWIKTVMDKWNWNTNQTVINSDLWVWGSQPILNETKTWPTKIDETNPDAENYKGPPIINMESNDKTTEIKQPKEEKAPIIQSNGWIIESYTHNENSINWEPNTSYNPPICPVVDNWPQINALEKQILNLEDQYSTCATKLNTAENIVNNMDFNTYIGNKIRENCKKEENTETCKDLYFKYRTYEK